jgi:hypothetical protein
MSDYCEVCAIAHKNEIDCQIVILQKILDMQWKIYEQLIKQVKVQRGQL